MKVLAQWRKLVARIRVVWNLAGRVSELEEWQKAQRTAQVAIANETNDLRKQLADLRAIVANIREESKRGPLQARSAAHLRQFISDSEGEG